MNSRQYCTGLQPHVEAPRRVFNRQHAVELRQQGMSYPQIARELGVGQGTVVRAVAGLTTT